MQVCVCMCECVSASSIAPTFCSLALKSIDLCVCSMEKMDLWKKLKNNTKIKLNLWFSVLVESVLSMQRTIEHPINSKLLYIHLIMHKNTVF